MRYPNYKNKICLVVGASSGSGRATAFELLDRGAIVIASSRNFKRLNLLRLGTANVNKLKNFFIKKVDVTKPESVNELVKYIDDRFGTLDFCFNFAGVCFYKDFLKTTDKEISKIVSLNFIGAVYLLRRIINYFMNEKRHGAKYFVQAGSMAGVATGHKKFSLYAATKEALAGLLRTLQDEYRESNIRFVLVTPAGVDTEIYKASLGDKISLEKKFKKSRLDTPEDLACGILDKLESGKLVDGGIRLLPTALSKVTYEKLSKTK